VTVCGQRKEGRKEELRRWMESGGIRRKGAAERMGLTREEGGTEGGKNGERTGSLLVNGMIE